MISPVAVAAAAREMAAVHDPEARVDRQRVEHGEEMHGADHRGGAGVGARAAPRSGRHRAGLAEAETALARASGLTDLGLHWLEEPVAADPPPAVWQRLRRAIPIPLAAGENLPAEAAFAAAIGAGDLRRDPARLCQTGRRDGLSRGRRRGARRRAALLPALPRCGHRPTAFGPYPRGCRRRRAARGRHQSQPAAQPARPRPRQAPRRDRGSARGPLLRCDARPGAARSLSKGRGLRLATRDFRCAGHGRAGNPWPLGRRDHKGKTALAAGSTPSGGRAG